MMILIRKNGGVELIRFADNNSFAFLSLSLSLLKWGHALFACLRTKLDQYLTIN